MNINPILQEKEPCATNQHEICFDLQNVVSFPYTEMLAHSFTSENLLYIILLLMHLSAIWTEAMSGREGNGIASAFVTILSTVVNDFPTVSDIIVWSDSCVPQIRNQVISFAVTYFWHTMHYSIPGHSAVQEVDNMHSQIEKSYGCVRILFSNFFLAYLVENPQIRPL